MKIHCEVAYASFDQQYLIPVEVEEGCTLAEAIQQSGLLNHFPDMDLSRQSVGIFSQPRSLSSRVSAGDRIEIYRALLIHPTEARRNKAKNRGV